MCRLKGVSGKHSNHENNTRAIMLFIISVKIYGAIMMKVTFEIKIFSLNKVKKKGFTSCPGDLFSCDTGYMKRTIF